VSVCYRGGCESLQYWYWYWLYPIEACTARPTVWLPAAVSQCCVAWITQGRARADGIQTVVALATPSFSETLIQRNPDGSLPPQTPELLSKMVPPMFAALQRTLAPLLVEQQGRLHEPAFVQVRSSSTSTHFTHCSYQSPLQTHWCSSSRSDITSSSGPLSRSLSFVSLSYLLSFLGAQMGECSPCSTLWEPLPNSRECVTGRVRRLLPRRGSGERCVERQSCSGSHQQASGHCIQLM